MPVFVVLCRGKVFEESCRGISDALTLIGAQVSIQKGQEQFEDNVVYIIPGLHKLEGGLPNRFIAVQTEQTTSRWFTPEYIASMQKAMCVWDFSPLNASRCMALGLRNVCWVPVRVPMDVFVFNTNSYNFHFQWRPPQDIDVLFYGSDSPRRREMFRLLSKTPGRTVVFRYYSLFDQEREHLLRRSKVVLNLHYWPDGALEVHRVEYACSRGKCVVSEPSADQMLDLTYKDCVTFARYADIPSVVTELLEHPAKRCALQAEAQKHSFKTQFDVRAVRACIGSIK